MSVLQPLLYSKSDIAVAVKKEREALLKQVSRTVNHCGQIISVCHTGRIILEVVDLWLDQYKYFC